uniref:Autophagy-related protein 27 n=1 Tax=Amphimedon queenslandica TaxID=400682 RepID=A0A1X7UVI5_AMPQE
MFLHKGIAGMVFLILLISLSLEKASAQVEICGEHDVYDVASLKKQPLWYSTISDPTQCAGGSSGDHCTVKFSVCGPLPPDTCSSTSDSTAFCQVITNSVPGSEHDTGKQTLIINEANGTLGFQFIYQNGSAVGNCNQTETVVLFQCDPAAQWDAYDPDVTRFLTGFLADISDECLYLMTLKYSGACIAQKPIYPQLCQLDGYDIEKLSEPDAWTATVPVKDCYNPSIGQGSCSFLFSFCKEIPHGQCYNSAFCQSGSNGVSFGKFDKDQKIFENDGGDGFTITYGHGTNTTDCPDGLFSTLVFTCNKDANWTFDPDINLGNITQFITAEPTFKDCEYIVRFNYSGACNGGSLSPTLAPSGSSPPSIVGWILIGIFFGVVALYISVGVLVQAIRGKKGKELIPNHELWGAIFLYVVGGCQVTIDFVTCYKFKSPMKEVKYDAL